MNLLVITIYVISLSMLGELFRIIRGPTFWDKLMSANVIGLKTIMLLVIFANQYDLTFLLDVALIYGLIGFIGIALIANRLAEGKRDYD